MDRPIRQLDDVIASDSVNVAALIDDAAAHLARYSTESRFTDLLAATTLAWRATRRDTGNAAARFDLAMALEGMYLADEATDAWRQSAPAIPASGWSVEALEHARKLAALDSRTGGKGQLQSARAKNLLSDTLVDRLGRDDAEVVRVYVLETLLPEWANASLSGDSTGAEAMLADAIRVGGVLARATHDSIAVLVTDAIRSLAAKGRAGRLTHALQLYGNGQALYKSDQYARAAPDLSTAMALVEQDARAEGPEVHRGLMTLHDWIALSAAMIHIYGGRFPTADSLHRAIVAHPTNQRSPALLGQAEWGLGISLGRQSDLSGSILNYKQAAEHLGAAGDRVGQGNVLTQLGAIYQRTGFYNQALLTAFEGQRVLVSHRSGYALGIGLLNLGYALDRMGETVPAMMAQREAVRVAARVGQPADRAETLARLADLLSRAGLVVEATVALDSADQAVRAVADVGVRSRMEAEIAVTRGSLVGPAQPAEAIAILTRAIDYYDRLHLAVKVAAPLQVRALARLRVGDTTRALDDLQSAVGILEKRAEVERDSDTRVAMVAVQGSLYRSLVDLHLRKGDTALAMEFASRALPPLGRPGGGSARPPRPLGPASATIAFTVLADRLLVWARIQGRMRVRETRIRRPELVRAIMELEQSLRLGGDTAVAVRHAQELYRIVMGPVEGDLAGVNQLVVVPDLELQRLPFAALRNPRSGHFLIEDMSVEVTSNWMAQGRSQVEVGRGATASTLLVDASAFDPRLFPDVSRLPFARAELDSIHAAHPGFTLVDGKDADRESLLHLIPRYATVHFAGHAVALEGRPELAYLITSMAPGEAPANVLTGADILRMDLRHTGLVILSACGTVPGVDSPVGGIASLSEAFLAAGAGSVVSSIWEVDDRSTAGFMQRFYLELDTKGVAEALRRAQLWSLRNPDPQYRRIGSWGAFRVEG